MMGGIDEKGYVEVFLIFCFNSDEETPKVTCPIYRKVSLLYCARIKLMIPFSFGI